MELVDFVPEITVEVLWSAKVGKGTKDHYLRLPPSIIDGRLIAADYRGQVSAFDVSTGEQLWKTELDLPITGGPGGGNGLVVVGTKDALVIALDAVNGSLIWQANVSSEILSAPSVGGGVVVIRSADGQIYGLDASNGSRLWVYQYNVPILTLRGAATPVIADSKVIIGLSGGKLVALSLKDGQLLWERTIVVPRGRTELDRLVDIDSEPVVHEGYLYTVTYNGRIAAVWLADGDVLWTREMSSYAGIGVDEDTIYVTDTEGHVWALESRTGASLWRQSKLLRRQPTAPTPYQNYIVVGDFAGYVHWMAKDDGRFVARLQVGEEGIVNAPLVVDDILYIISKGGILKAIKVSSD
jgi:outer membrane protein assembly factor BamB